MLIKLNQIILNKSFCERVKTWKEISNLLLQVPRDKVLQYKLAPGKAVRAEIMKQDQRKLRIKM